jgi:hypothetical protein
MRSDYVCCTRMATLCDLQYINILKLLHFNVMDAKNCKPFHLRDKHCVCLQFT